MRIATILANVCLLGAVFYLMAKYPTHIEGGLDCEYCLITGLMVLTPVLSVIALLRPSRNGRVRATAPQERIETEPLDKFGAFVVQNLRDKMIADLEKMLSGACKAPELQELQSKLSGLTDAQKQLIRELTERNITAGMHDLLFAIADSGGEVRVLVDGHDVAKLSDGLHGEIFGDEGWIVRFSKYPSRVEIERSKWAREWIQEHLDKNKDVEK